VAGRRRMANFGRSDRKSISLFFTLCQGAGNVTEDRDEISCSGWCRRNGLRGGYGPAHNGHFMRDLIIGIVIDGEILRIAQLGNAGAEPIVMKHDEFALRQDRRDALSGFRQRFLVQGWYRCAGRDRCDDRELESACWGETGIDQKAIPGW